MHAELSAYLLLVAPRLLPERVSAGDRTERYGVGEYLGRVLVPSRSPLVGATASEVVADAARDLDLDVLDIVRGDEHFLAGSGREIAARDVLTVRGDPETIRTFVDLVDLRLLPGASVTDAELDPEGKRPTLVEVVVPTGSDLVGETVAASRLRERYDATILAIRPAGGELIREGFSDVTLDAGDSLLLQTTPESAEFLVEARDLVATGELVDDLVADMDAEGLRGFVRRLDPDEATEVLLAAARAQPRAPLTADDYVEGVLAGNRAMLGRTITIIESRSDRHQELAQEILLRFLQHLRTVPDEERAHRIGITGVPGVGKSTFIESLGKRLTAAGHRVAVLAVDPSSTLSGGSILGDKTRMQDLSVDPNAFIRPSPSSGTLGGVTRTTRATMVVCEAAGYDVILVETVGAGQSEVAVSDMTDFFLVLALPGAGDELQGIKKGVLEIADMIAVNKADGDNEVRAKQAAVHYRNALKIMKHTSPNWTPPVVLCSGLANMGLDKLWDLIEEHKAKLTETGELMDKRRQQRIGWMWSMLENRLIDSLKTNEHVVELLPQVQHDVAEGKLTVTLGVERIMEAYRG